MVHTVAPKPTWNHMPAFFNVDKHVGPAKPNKPDDVMLVQFGLQSLGKNPPTQQPMSPALRTQLAALQVTGICDPSTVAAIKAFQQFRKQSFAQQTVDGIVSPAQGGYGYGGDTLYTIAELCIGIKKRARPTWPAFHLDNACPSGLKPVIALALSGD